MLETLPYLGEDGAQYGIKKEALEEGLSLANA